MSDAHPFRLGRKFSLGKNRNYQYVYRRGHCYASKYMSLTYLRSRGQRVGFSASSKVGNAVTRNRIRRWLTEDFRMRRASLVDGRYVFVARVAANTLTHAALSREVDMLLARARVFRSANASERPTL